MGCLVSCSCYSASLAAGVIAAIVIGSIVFCESTPDWIGVGRSMHVMAGPLLTG